MEIQLFRDHFTPARYASMQFKNTASFFLVSLFFNAVANFAESFGVAARDVNNPRDFPQYKEVGRAFRSLSYRYESLFKKVIPTNAAMTFWEPLGGIRDKVVGSSICQEVNDAKKYGGGKLITIVIQGHGTNSDGMILSKSPEVKKISVANDFKECFANLDPSGTLVLMGSSLGQNGTSEDNIAKKIADDSRRTVLATTCPIFPSDTKIQSIDPLMLMHPEYSAFYNFIVMGCPENNDNHFNFKLCV